MAPVCEHRGCRMIGHGVEAEGHVYCCARMVGVKASRAEEGWGKRREEDEHAPRGGTIAPPLVDQGPRGGPEGSRANSRLSWCGKIAARETARSTPAVSMV